MSADPLLVVAVDPDSVRSALAWAYRVAPKVYELDGFDGGGSSRSPVLWQSVRGSLAWIEGATVRGTERARLIDYDRVTVVMEAQASAGEHSRDVEPLRRVRYHWDAACELRGCGYVEALPIVWEPVFSKNERVTGRGARKKACHERADALTKSSSLRPTNGDQRDAFGMLWWYIVDVRGCELRLPQKK